MARLFGNDLTLGFAFVINSSKPFENSLNPTYRSIEESENDSE
jgi:hypothetical protein